MNYVISELRKIGLQPDARALREHVRARTRGPSGPSTLGARADHADAPNGKTFVNGLTATGDFAQMTWSQTADITAQVIPVARITDPAAGDRRDGIRAAAR